MDKTKRIRQFSLCGTTSYRRDRSKKNLLSKRNMKISVVLIFIIIAQTNTFSQTNIKNLASFIEIDHQNEELLISKMNDVGKLDTIDLFKVIRGIDKTTYFIDQNKDTVNHETFKQSVNLLDFWFLNCKPCIVELPGLDLLNKKINSKSFNLITFARDSIEVIEEKLLSKKQFSFKIIPNINLISQKLYPTKILLDKKSEVIDYVSFGNTSKNSINKILEKYIPLIKKELRK